MPLRSTPKDLLEPVDDASCADLPPRFAEALGQLRMAIANFETAGIPAATIIAALMTELMPRLVQTYGPTRAALVLGRVAEEVLDPPIPSTFVQ